MGRLDGVDSPVDGLLAAIFISRTETQHQDGIFIGFVLHGRVIIGTDADFCGLLQSRRGVFDFGVQRIAGSKRRGRKSTERSQG